MFSKTENIHTPVNKPKQVQKIYAFEANAIYKKLTKMTFRHYNHCDFIQIGKKM